MAQAHHYQRHIRLPLLIALSLSSCDRSNDVTAFTTSIPVQRTLLPTNNIPLLPSKPSSPFSQQYPSHINPQTRPSHLTLSQNPDDLKSAAPGTPATVGTLVDTLNDLLSRAKTSLSTLDVQTALQNTLSTEPTPLGSRGEIYVAIQALLVLSVLLGSVPFVQGLLSFLLGPVLFFVGAGTVLLGAGELGPNFSPWPVPASTPPAVGEGLVRSGLVFSEVRHPIYAGLLCLCAGLGVWTGSATRLVLTVGLYLLLDVKAAYEEEGLVGRFGAEYLKYREEVPGRFVPGRLVRALERIKVGR